eukprot:scaffold145108_cov21-Tisochrysis_lutea.AAC.4
MSGEVFWDDTDDGSAIGADVRERSLGMLQYGGTYMPAVAVVRQLRSIWRGEGMVVAVRLSAIDEGSGRSAMVPVPRQALYAPGFQPDDSLTLAS